MFIVDHAAARTSQLESVADTEWPTQYRSVPGEILATRREPGYQQATADSVRVGQRI